MKKILLLCIIFFGSVYSKNHFNTKEKRFYSQFGEDGVISEIFKLIGTTDKFYVDIGAGDGKNISNIFNLSLSGWKGIGIDGAYSVPQRNIFKHYITAENILNLLDNYVVPNNFDFLSLDIDSNDLYILATILKAGYKPRVICAEYNASFPIDEDKCVQYDPKLTWNGSFYYGASYAAFKNILSIFDYVPIATTSQGVNVFFIEKQNLEQMKNIFIGSDFDIFNKANYGSGPNGGHPVDPLKRTFGSSKDVIRYIGLEN
jgi:hypothetical protein